MKNSPILEMLAKKAKVPCVMLELSVRSHNALQNAGILYVQDLLTWTKEQLLDLQNCGRKSVNEIIYCLAEHSLALAEIQTRTPKTTNKEDFERETYIADLLRDAEESLASHQRLLEQAKSRIGVLSTYIKRIKSGHETRGNLDDVFLKKCAD